MGMMDSYSTGQVSQQMNHKKGYACTIASRRVSVLALCFRLNEAEWNCEEDDGW